MFFSVSILHHSSPFIDACLSNPLYQQFDGFSFIKPLATYLAVIQKFPLPRSFKVSTMNQSFYHTYYHALGLSAHISCCFQYIFPSIFMLSGYVNLFIHYLSYVYSDLLYIVIWYTTRVTVIISVIYYYIFV